MDKELIAGRQAAPQLPCTNLTEQVEKILRQLRHNSSKEYYDDSRNSYQVQKTIQYAVSPSPESLFAFPFTVHRVRTGHLLRQLPGLDGQVLLALPREQEEREPLRGVRQARPLQNHRQQGGAWAIHGREESGSRDGTSVAGGAGSRHGRDSKWTWQRGPIWNVSGGVRGDGVRRAQILALLAKDCAQE